jgi:hypothetical protein
MSDNPDGTRDLNQRGTISTRTTIVSLIAWPLAVQLVLSRVSHDLLTIGLLALASIVFYTGFTILLRSRVLVGTLAGVFAGTVFNPTSITSEADETWASFVYFFTVIGIMVGWGWHLVSNPKKEAASPR